VTPRLHFFNKVQPTGGKDGPVQAPRLPRRPRRFRGAAILIGLLAVIVVGIFLGSALAPSHSDGRAGGTDSEGPVSVPNPLAGRVTTVVGTDVPAARFGEEAAAREDFGENLAGEKVSDILPISARRFVRPVKEYKAYAAGWIDRTIADARALRAALAGHSRPAARRAWETTWGDYMHLGADYGLFGELEEGLEGTFRRLEWGLWTGRPLHSLTSRGEGLVTDLKHLRAALPGVEIDALDYATRGHEIVEDAQRDLLSGADVPWSHQGVLGTAGAVASAEEVFRTLKPLLSGRENTEPEVEYWLLRLHRFFGSLRHDGRYPSTTEMGTAAHERMNGYVAGALSALQMVPSTLETKAPKAPPSIGSSE
jgi:hypothetical protein